MFPSCCYRGAWVAHCILLLLLAFQARVALAGEWWGGRDEPQPQVQVAEPFVEWHTGPGSAYPVFHASEQGEWLTLLKRKTQWLKVRDERGQEGWVHVNEVLKTLNGRGEPVTLSEPRFDDFSSRRWEAGLLFGDFEGATVNSAYLGYWMTENLAVELSGAQALGDASEILMTHLNLVHQPFPTWRASPFFTMGIGQLFVDPKATLANPENRDNTAANVGLGMRFYVQDRFFIRAEVKDYKIFTDLEDNQEATEWKIGLSVFF
ncbi:SH3 domain-containing protein [Marinobacteraceae bacterium S3BR75-40.1]